MMERKKKSVPHFLTTAVIGFSLLGFAPAFAVDSTPSQDQYRPTLHYTPQENWMNDPNGLVYEDGVWHLFYQHNPEGSSWGNMSWGHATSTDLMNWEEQPLAIPQTFDTDHNSIEDIFSGSIVVDHNNSSGLGTVGSAPLIAIYTSAYTDKHPTLSGIQAQSIAYSNDHGQTWHKYEQNPVLDRNSGNFRDPKVFWYENPDTGEAYWVMIAVEATDYQVVLYRSEDLLDWDYLSDFGPANAVGGIWECPDLFELPIDGDPNNTKWVMIVNMNPGAIAGGSGGQYFVGDFDGVSFTSESTVPAAALPDGEVFEDFEGSYDGWTLTSNSDEPAAGPWGIMPASQPIAGQHPVGNFVGDGLVNSFLGGDGPTGTMESQTFTIDQPYINLLTGGGNHPRVQGTQATNTPPAGELLFNGFEDTDSPLIESGWELTGDFLADPATTASTAGGEYFIGEGRLNTFEMGPNGDNNVGDVTSPAFEIGSQDTQLSFLLGGGSRSNSDLEVQLLIGGEVQRSATGPESGELNWVSWDIAEFAGLEAQVRLHDSATGGWGHLTLDHVVLGDEKALERNNEVSANLIVDGQVVRSATGNDSENLDWNSWDVEDYIGQEAHISIVDNHSGGWGHILVDHIMFSASPVANHLENYDWLDWGRDFYATVSFSNVPDNRRVLIGWMNNWEYAGDTPTGNWRSAMSLPRDVELVTTAKGPRLTQKVVSEIGSYEQNSLATTLGAQTLTDGTHATGMKGETVKIEATFEVDTAEAFGIEVFAGPDSGTKIGYDTTSNRLFVDRTNSGNVSFNSKFPSVDSAPVSLIDGKVTFTVYMDRASVEVFTPSGDVAITDLVYPKVGSDQINLWAKDGEAKLVNMTVTPLAPSIGQSPQTPEESTVPGVPTGIEAISNEAGSAHVAWEAPKDTGGSAITGYRVYAQEPQVRDDFGTLVCETDGSTTSCDVNTLLPGSTYVFALVAVNAQGDGEAGFSAALEIRKSLAGSGQDTDDSQDADSDAKEPDADSGTALIPGDSNGASQLPATGFTGVQWLIGSLLLLATGGVFALVRRRQA